MFTDAVSSYRRALQRWVPLLSVHLFVRLILLAVLVPLIGALLALTLSFSDQSALTDQDIARFLLTPAGALGAVVLGAFVFVAIIIDIAVMTAILRSKSLGVAEPMRSAVWFLADAAPRMAVFGGFLLLRILLIAAPFLAVGAGVAAYLLRAHDINFYLSTRPPEFMLALGVGGLCLLGLALLLLERLSAWAVAMHLSIFDREPPRHAFAASRAVMEGHRLALVRRIVAWFILRFAAVSVLAGASGFLLAEVPVLFTGNLQAFFVVTALLLALWAVSNALLSAISNGALAGVLNAEFDRCLAGRPARNEVRTPKALSGYLMAPLLLAGLGVAALTLSGFLSNQIGGAGEVQVIAHRGASASRPENTMAAVVKAVEDGADWVEIDVQETADGEVLVVHDSDFMKAAGVPVKVWDVTMPQIADIDIGSWYDPAYASERAPLLRDVLEVVRDRSGLLIELKYYGHDVDLENRVAMIVEEAGMADQIATMSLKYPAVQKMRKLRPDWRTGVLAATAVGNLARLEGDFIAVSTSRASASLINHAEAQGKQVYVWTVNDAATMSRMISLGAHGLITDEPALARKVIDHYADLSTPERLVLRLGDLVGRSFDFTPEEEVGI